MKVRVHFTGQSGVESFVDYTSNVTEVLNEDAKAILKEQVWFDLGEVSIDGIVEVKE